jgi:nucleotide-binding universal stress UspA family protein
MYQSILIPTDGSQGARRGMQHGLDLAEQYGADVHVLHVINEGRWDTPALSSVELSFEKIEAFGDQAVREIVEEAERRGLNVEHSRVRGTPYEKILSYAADHDVDLIVMGRRGIHGRESPHLGSTTNRVLKAADVPVMPV